MLPTGGGLFATVPHWYTNQTRNSFNHVSRPYHFSSSIRISSDMLLPVHKQCPLHYIGLLLPGDASHRLADFRFSVIWHTLYCSLRYYYPFQHPNFFHSAFVLLFCGVLPSTTLSYPSDTTHIMSISPKYLKLSTRLMAFPVCHQTWYPLLQYHLWC